MKATARANESGETPAHDSQMPESKIAARQAAHRLVGFFEIGGEYLSGFDPREDVHTLADAVAQLEG